MTTAGEFFRQAVATGQREQGTDSEGHRVELDPQDGWQHLDGSVSHDDGTTVSDHPVRHTASYTTVAQIEESFRRDREREIRRADFLRYWLKESAADPGEVHRGVSIVLPKHVHDIVHDERQPLPARAHLLLSHVRKQRPEIMGEEGTQGGTGGVGEMWSPDHGVAQRHGQHGGFDAYHQHEAEHGCGDPNTGDGGCRTTNVVMHAKTPSAKHHWDEIMRPGEKYNPAVSWRLPVRPGAPMSVHGISWHEGDDHLSTDDKFTLRQSRGTDSEGRFNPPPMERYDFSAPVKKRASAVGAFRQAMGMDHLDLYHRTTPEAAAAIHAERRMHSKENTGEAYFSTFRGDEPDAQNHGYGEGVVHIRVPEHLAEIDDEFPSGEQHYRVDTRQLRPEHFVGSPHTAALGATAFFQGVLAETIVAQSAAEVADGVMVAFFPPHDIADELAKHGTEPAEQLHVTLAYLGKTADYTPDQLAALPKLVAGWAAGQKPVPVEIGGVGKFTSSEQHVLIATASIPGGTHLHSSLENFLHARGYKTPSKFGWVAHLTLAYVGKHFRFLPPVPAVSWTADRVLVCIGGTHTPVLLGGS